MKNARENRNESRLQPARWDRQPGESIRQFASFRAYRDLHPLDRSLAEVGRKLGVSTGYCERLSSRFPAWKVSARGDFEALVPECLFRRVQRILDGKGEPVRPHSRNHPDFPLRRFVACSHCLTPLTGSWSTGRSKKYPYYHCRKCKRVTSGKQALEELFVELLSRLQPEAGYMRLFNAIVLDVRGVN